MRKAHPVLDQKRACPQTGQLIRFVSLVLNVQSYFFRSHPPYLDLDLTFLKISPVQMPLSFLSAFGWLMLYRPAISEKSVLGIIGD